MDGSVNIDATIANARKDSHLEYTLTDAIARIVGWSAHRIEELINMDKIIRPAYKSVMQELEYVPLDQR